MYESGGIDMYILEKYKQVRRVGMELNNRMLEQYVMREQLEAAGRLLGVLSGNYLHISEEEEPAFFDFLLHEPYMDGPTAVEQYRRDHLQMEWIEKQLTEAFLAAYTSLFMVAGFRREESTLILEDLLNGGLIPLLDIHYSRTAEPGTLLFTRVVPYRGFNMSSGFSLHFYLEADRLIQKYQKQYKKVPSDTDSIRRFVAFFALSRRYGTPAIHRSVQ